ncbi:phosphatidylinositol 4,5-bisphosphate 5-phosphatase A-like isoform X2 [Varroa jacobsoni]|uniref:phosphatidylinositol 4,5-bisphosphate 5-phosphatase A-like isoform X2 n=1 Tax=Varroa jacobsoni TaxID=62625 RepID=UPI000BFA713D|nr:phosphatidylinositol 4,5-bisphosphate 5-phosphatase A-like isoform X2 [Varroa jacobsoni]
MTDPKLRNFSIRVITWNVAGTSPTENLRNLLGVRKPFDKNSLPDLYAVGYQEVSMRPRNVLSEMLLEQEWITPLRQILAELDYVKLISYRLQGLVLAIFVRRMHLHHIRNIYSTCVRTGVLGSWGNKGASIVSLRAYGASMSFTNSHLAAHDHGYKRRLGDYAAIATTAWCGPNGCYILDHDYVFWFGDLNFRLDERITIDDLRKAIKDEAVMEMLQYDQLHRAQRDEDAFETMTEGKISFKPTFKYQTGTTDFRLKTRRPAWTDRILYRCNEDTYQGNKFDITAHEYRSHEDYVQSDHKPVSALFTVKVFSNDTVFDRVYFFNTSDWSISRGFELWFCTPTNAQPQNLDWIGLMQENFTTLDKYLAYIWVDTRPMDTISFPDDENPILPTPRHVYRQTFSDQMVVLPGTYQLVYFRSKCDVLGVSDPFKVTKLPSHRQMIPSYYRVSS